MPQRPVVLWFRNDLRLIDHRALTAAVATDAPVVALYVLDDVSPGSWKLGGASRWWLHASLVSLGQSIAERGGKLILRRGDSAAVVSALAKEIGAGAVYCSRAYEPWAQKIEQVLRARLKADGVDLKRYSGALLHEPDQVATQTGAPYKVYTPFWRALERIVNVSRTLPSPERIAAPDMEIASDTLASWQLLPATPDWAGGLRAAWQPGETGARHRLAAFIESPIRDYAVDRDRPDLAGTSRLSPHLHFGEISPAQCWHVACFKGGRGESKGRDTFLRELVWREFSYHLLFHNPDLPNTPFRKEFAAFPWSSDYDDRLAAWQRGRTGYPIVDAGMRELWATGWMHNRVRMIAASFLIKNLMIPWQAGEAWFWETLVDADLASNAASWQWVAGCGADAAPYFRIFNPVTQGLKFDPDGAYVRRWIPELSRLSPSEIHRPWEASASALAAADISLGKTYPHPLIDHAAARLRALEAYEHVKAAADG